VVITGVGGMGSAVARRIGSGSTLVLADVSQGALSVAADALRADGYEVAEVVTDVSDPGSVTSLAEAAIALGRVEVLVHTAGVSPVQASVSAIMQVDLLGTALMLDAFATAIAPGGAGVFIASMAGTMAPPDADRDRRLATTPTAELLDLTDLEVADSGMAYVVAKRANQVRVRAAAAAWGGRRARVNSISPGVISTPMGTAELEGASGEFMRQMVTTSPTGRIGTPHDIAGAVEFLTGPNATFITGTDLLVDGGVIATLTSS
jgi:NAD(P)-dependent dehydrogenase (short-subunit alcohol dehydrogenase family)